MTATPDNRLSERVTGGQQRWCMLRLAVASMRLAASCLHFLGRATQAKVLAEYEAFLEQVQQLVTDAIVAYYDDRSAVAEQERLLQRRIRLLENLVQMSKARAISAAAEEAEVSGLKKCIWEPLRIVRPQATCDPCSPHTASQARRRDPAAPGASSCASRGATTTD